MIRGFLFFDFQKVFAMRTSSSTRSLCAAAAERRRRNSSADSMLSLSFVSQFSPGSMSMTSRKTLYRKPSSALHNGGSKRSVSGSFRLYETKNLTAIRLCYFAFAVRDAERLLVNVDDRNQQREHERTEHEADESERFHPAEDGDQERDGRELHLSLHRPRPDHVLDDRHDDDAPDRQEDHAEVAAFAHRRRDVEVERRRNPDRRGADDRKQRQHRRHRAPEDRAGNSGDGQADADEDSLRQRRDDLSAKRRVDYGLEVLRELMVIARRQRRKRRRLGHDRLP